MSIRQSTSSHGNSRKRRRLNPDESQEHISHKRAKSSADQSPLIGEQSSFLNYSPTVSRQQAPVHSIQQSERAIESAEQVEAKDADVRPVVNAASTQPLPLTKDALELLNQSNRPEDMGSSYINSESAKSSASEGAVGSINAYNDNFDLALKHRGVHYYNDTYHSPPDGLEELWSIVTCPRDSPELDDADIQALRRVIVKAKSESDTVEVVLPLLVPWKSIAADPKLAIAANQKWSRTLGVNADSEYRLRAAKPDHTIGWDALYFQDHYEKASKFLSAFICPVAGNSDLAWPLFTVEEKGAKGSMTVAMRQNLYNAAVMLSNLLALKEKAQNKTASEIDGSFFNKIHVMSLELTNQTVSLSCYWASRTNTGIVRYLGTTLQIWALRDRTGNAVREARRCIQNALDHVKRQAHDWICADMEMIEAMCSATKPSKITPPPTPTPKYGVGKRRKSKAPKTKSTGSSSPDNIDEDDDAAEGSIHSGQPDAQALPPPS